MGLSLKAKGSRNLEMARRKQARLRHRVACVWRVARRQLATDLTRSFRAIGVEDLIVKGRP
jgi:transposase